MKILRVAGPSNSGKTSLLLSIIKELKCNGLQVATIKHSHHSLTLPQKDSTQFTVHGSDYSLAIGEDFCQMITPKKDKTPQEWIDWLFPEVDVLLIEGWRKYSFPTILVSNQKPPQDWFLPNQIIGYVGWAPQNSRVFKDAIEISEWILYS